NPPRGNLRTEFKTFDGAQRRFYFFDAEIPYTKLRNLIVQKIANLKRTSLFQRRQVEVPRKIIGRQQIEKLRCRTREGALFTGYLLTLMIECRIFSAGIAALVYVLGVKVRKVGISVNVRIILVFYCIEHRKSYRSLSKGGQVVYIWIAETYLRFLDLQRSCCGRDDSVPQLVGQFFSFVIGGIGKVGQGLSVGQTDTS